MFVNYCMLLVCSPKQFGFRPFRALLPVLEPAMLHARLLGKGLMRFAVARAPLEADDKPRTS